MEKLRTTRSDLAPGPATQLALAAKWNASLAQEMESGDLDEYYRTFQGISPEEAFRQYMLIFSLHPDARIARAACAKLGFVYPCAAEAEKQPLLTE